jgi:hypothetical protein
VVPTPTFEIPSVDEYLSVNDDEFDDNLKLKAKSSCKGMIEFSLFLFNFCLFCSHSFDIYFLEIYQQMLEVAFHLRCSETEKHKLEFDTSTFQSVSNCLFVSLIIIIIIIIIIEAYSIVYSRKNGRTRNICPSN